MAVDVGRLQSWQQRVRSQVVEGIKFPLSSEEFVKRLRLPSEQRWKDVSEKIRAWLPRFQDNLKLAEETFDDSFLRIFREKACEEIKCHKIFYFSNLVALEVIESLKVLEVDEDLGFNPAKLDEKMAQVEARILASCPQSDEESEFEIVDDAKIIVTKQHALLESWIQDPVLLFKA
jgi:hypothetical protein